MSEIKIRSEKIEMVAVDCLVEHPDNPHRHSKKQITRLAKLIEYQGFRVPIIVDKDTGYIVSGHGRKMAAEKLGLKKVPVIFQDFETDDQVRAYLVSDNAIGKDGWASIDYQMLNDQIGEWSPDFDIELLGIENFEIDVPIDLEKEEIEDDVPENVDTRCKPGDLWILGEHRLLCGDSTNIQHVERLMGGEKADMVFTDPPYGFNYKKKSDQGTIKNDGYEFAQVISDSMAIVDQITKPQEYFVWGDFRTAGEFLEATSILGKPKSCIVWSKPIQHRMHKFEPCHEFCWYWGANGSPFFGKNVVESKREIKPDHPTMKPIDMITHLLSSNKLKTVLDLFGGSGSTLIACEKTNRKCYMMELDPHYCDVILARWEKYSGKTAELDQTNVEKSVGTSGK